MKNLSALDNRCSPCLGQTRGTQFHGSNSNCHLPVSKPSPLPLRQNLHLHAEIKPSGLSQSEFTVAPKMKSPDYTELYIIPNFSRKALFYKVSCKNIRYIISYNSSDKTRRLAPPGFVRCLLSPNTTINKQRRCTAFPY